MYYKFIVVISIMQLILWIFIIINFIFTNIEPSIVHCMGKVNTTHCMGKASYTYKVTDNDIYWYEIRKKNPYFNLLEASELHDKSYIMYYDALTNRHFHQLPPLDLFNIFLRHQEEIDAPLIIDQGARLEINLAWYLNLNPELVLEDDDMYKELVREKQPHVTKQYNKLVKKGILEN